MEQKTSRTITITFPNREEYILPAYIVANHRTEFYAEKENFEKGSRTWHLEFDLFMKDTEELIDWLENNMDWEDVEMYATKIETPKLPLAEMWHEAKIKMNR